MASLARLALASFLLTFVSVRCLVLLIMSRRLPDLYVYLGGTHVHHLNFGIVLLSVVGAYLLFGSPRGRSLSLAAALYGVGLALTFDEFGMWLHLGGSYWQRASYDAVTLIACSLALLAAAPHLRQFRPRHWVVSAALFMAVVLFAVLLLETVHHVERRVGPSLERIEEMGPR